MFFSRLWTIRLNGFITLFGLFIASTALLPAQADDRIIKLATTTSTENSGLLKYLLPRFEKQHDYEVKVISVGTGKALRLLKEGDIDVALVHARIAEERLVEDGDAVNRRDVMYNDFIVVGPSRDPAEINGIDDVTRAFRRIEKSQSLFISRGDDSGTHRKEMGLWLDAGITPHGGWYREVGQGMGKVLQIASELQAYTLCDRGTWLAYQGRLPLKILSQGDKRLFNPYGILATNPEKHPDANHKGATTLIEWMVSPDAQQAIADFTIYDKRLFYPMPETGEVQAH